MSANLPERKVCGHTPSLDRQIAAIARRQRDLITVAQLLATGLTDGAITKRVGRGALHRVHRGVYTVSQAPLEREALWLAAVLACGWGAGLSRLSLAELHGISRFRSPVITVVAPRRRALAGVKVHHCRTLEPRDITSYRNIPVTTIHRLLVDLSDELTPHQLANLIHEAAFRGRFVEAAVRDVMARANGRHNLRVLERAIELHRAGSAGTRSGAEDAFLRLGLPEPLVNTGLHGFEVDFHWPDRGLVVEVDGPGHGRPRDRLEDARRDRGHEAAGFVVLRFDDKDVYARPDMVTRATAAALTARTQVNPRIRT